MADYTSVVQTIASAIAGHENVNPKYNNPGGIMDTGYYAQTRNYRPQQYATLADGWNALYSQIDNYISGGYTFNTMFSKYSPPDTGTQATRGNNPVAYASQVAGSLGVDPSTKISDVISGSVSDTNPPIDSNSGLPVYSTTIWASPDATPSGDVLVSTFNTFGDSTSLASMIGGNNWIWLLVAGTLVGLIAMGHRR